MKVMRLRFILLISLFAIFFITACDPDEKPTPTRIPSTPTPVSSPTPPGTPTSTPTPTTTPTATNTATPTSTPTETPQPTFVSQPGPQPTTLVTKGAAEARAKYDEGFAKWRAQNVIEYEVVVQNNSTAQFAGMWTLHVSGPQIDVVSYSAPNVITPTTPPDFMVGEALKFMTVDGLFASIDARLTSEGFGTALEQRVDYISTFDPELGYPISVEIRPKPNNKGQDLASSTIVKRLTIIKRSAPPAPPTPIPPTTVPPPPTNIIASAVVSPSAPTTLPSPSALATSSPARTPSPIP
ncbi:MAG TPA: DUF6174 domain-containing protein [Chloroflexia bacterium]|nr:DUF6174 domain-containing protein [Chloroflexia bacterium]